jgi:hypothetical protein
VPIHRSLLALAALTALEACRCAGPAPDPAEAPARCRAALDRIGDTPDDGRDFFRDFAAGCGAIHADAACRDAWTEAAAAPIPRRTSILARRCAPAACPGLPAPKPVLCSAPDEAVGDRVLEMRWFDLYRVLVERDLGARDPALVRLLVELQRPPPAEPVAVLQLLPEQDGAWLAQVGTSPAARLRDPSSESDLARLADALAELAPPESGSVLIRAEETLTDEALAPLRQALENKRFHRIAVERVPGRR